jgi:prepilin-type N-terminal cleavage/methylation domain-containing protein
VFRSSDPSHRLGYTLLEVLVVLVLLAVAATVVAPSLLAPRLARQSSSVLALVGSMRETAVRRGGMVRLRIDRSGDWQAFSGTPADREVLMSGRFSGPGNTAADIVFSPLGSCAPTPESVPPKELAGFDLLTCEPRAE